MLSGRALSTRRARNVFDAGYPLKGLIGALARRRSGRFGVARRKGCRYLSYAPYGAWGAGNVLKSAKLVDVLGVSELWSDFNGVSRTHGGA